MLHEKCISVLIFHGLISVGLTVIMFCIGDSCSPNPPSRPRPSLSYAAAFCRGNLSSREQRRLQVLHTSPSRSVEAIFVCCAASCALVDHNADINYVPFIKQMNSCVCNVIPLACFLMIAELLQIRFPFSPVTVLQTFLEVHPEQHTCLHLDNF
jgi:hypothetical protein